MIENFLRRPEGVGEFAADAVRLVGVVSIMIAAVWLLWTDVGILALALPALLLPRFIGVRSGFDIVFGLTVLLAAWSNVIDLYRSVPWWDILCHLVCTGVLAAMAYLVLARWGIVARPGGAGFRRSGAIVLTTIIGLALSAVWEVIEWLGFTFITDDIFVTYTDTIGDLVAGGAGSLAAGVVVAFVRLERAEPAAITAVTAVTPVTPGSSPASRAARR